MLRSDFKILGPFGFLVLPLLIYRTIKGIDVVPEYYPAKAEAVEQNEIYAYCDYCQSFRMHIEVVWLMPYAETRECTECALLTEPIK